MAFTYFSFEDVEELNVSTNGEHSLTLRFEAEDGNTYAIALYASSSSPKQKDFLKNLARALEPERLVPPTPAPSEPST